MILKYIIEKNDNYFDVNNVLISRFNLSNRLCKKLIGLQKVFLNERFVDTRTKVKSGDVISLDFSYNEDNSNIFPIKMNLDIIYEDKWFLVINKPVGIAVHPSVLHYNNSLSNGIKYYFDTINLKKKIRPVNRLDYNTSGLVIFAKCEYIHESFSKQMVKKEFIKEYLCLINGILLQKIGTINLPISRKEDSIIERCVNNCGQPCITHYEVINEFNNYSLVKCKLETGRTHQIRVHMSSIGHPILGDTLYGSNSTFISRQALHSYKIELIHPISKNKIIFQSDLPVDMKINK